MNNEEALNAFLARKTEIDNALARLQALSDNHFNADPGNVNWSDVATVGHIAQKLADIVEFAFDESE